MRDLDLKKKTRIDIHGCWSVSLTFKFWTHICDMQVCGCVGWVFLQSPPFYESSPSALLLGLFVVWKKLHFFSFFFEVITKLFMVAKKCELCPPLGVYVVACVCVILFWALWSYFSFSLFDPSSSSCDFLIALIFIHVDVKDPFMIPPNLLFYYGLLKRCNLATTCLCMLFSLSWNYCCFLDFNP